MASQLEMCNTALGLLGEMPIDDLTDTEDPKAVKCLVFWSMVLDEVLESHDWTFATARAKLQQDAIIPAYGFDYAYPVPSDFIRILAATTGDYDVENDSGAQVYYRFEGGRILSNAENMNLKYVYRVAEPGRFSPLFALAVSGALAVKLAAALTKSASTLQGMTQLAELWLSRAKASDNHQAGIETQRRSSWNDAR